MLSVSWVTLSFSKTAAEFAGPNSAVLIFTERCEVLPSDFWHMKLAKSSSFGSRVLWIFESLHRWTSSPFDPIAFRNYWHNSVNSLMSEQGLNSEIRLLSKKSSSKIRFPSGKCYLRISRILGLSHDAEISFLKICCWIVCFIFGK